VSKLTSGRLYNGSDAVFDGKLKGATGETDYFYFFCPKCPDDHILRILEYRVHEEVPENPSNEECKSHARHGFTLAFKLHCENCEYKDYVKVSNIGWQSGTHAEIIAK
jgi:hypothetical protein